MPTHEHLVVVSDEVDAVCNIWRLAHEDVDVYSKDVRDMALLSILGSIAESLDSIVVVLGAPRIK